MTSTPTELIRKFIRLFSERKWDEALGVLHPGFVAEWPQSRERFRSPRDYIEMNRRYPGNHQLTIVHVHEMSDLVIATIWIEADTGQKTFVTSYFKVQDGLVASAEEYWAEPYPAPVWRKHWVELY